MNDKPPSIKSLQQIIIITWTSISFTSILPRWIEGRFLVCFCLRRGFWVCVCVLAKRNEGVAIGVAPPPPPHKIRRTSSFGFKVTYLRYAGPSSSRVRGRGRGPLIVI